jgi:SsrA-binding protein
MARKKRTKTKAGKPGFKTLAENRRAGYKYIILDRFEAGMVLTGTEIKALREGRANLRDGFASIRGGEAWLVNCHISEYSHKGYASHDPLRTRKLLLHREEINKLTGKVEEKGLTLVPLRIYLKNGKAKCELGLVKGKKIFDHRETARRKIVDKEIRQELKRLR